MLEQAGYLVPCTMMPTRSARSRTTERPRPAASPDAQDDIEGKTCFYRAARHPHGHFCASAPDWAVPCSSS